MFQDDNKATASFQGPDWCSGPWWWEHRHTLSFLQELTWAHCVQRCISGLSPEIRELLTPPKSYASCSSTDSLLLTFLLNTKLQSGPCICKPGDKGHISSNGELWGWSYSPCLCLYVKLQDDWDVWVKEVCGVLQIWCKDCLCMCPVLCVHRFLHLNIQSFTHLAQDMV